MSRRRTKRNEEEEKIKNKKYRPRGNPESGRIHDDNDTNPADANANPRFTYHLVNIGVTSVVCPPLLKPLSLNLPFGFRGSR